MPLDERVKKRVRELIDIETEKALKEGNEEYASGLQEAKRLVTREAIKLRPENPYNVFMKQCLIGEGEGSPTERMAKCGEEWSGLSEEEKKKYETGELIAADYT